MATAPRKRRVRPDPTTVLVVRLESLRAKKKELDSEIKELQASLLDEMGEETHREVVKGDSKWVVTKVEGTSVVLNEDKLRKRVGTAMWNKITTRVLDKNKLDAFVKSDEVKPEDVAIASEEYPRTPYVKITKKSA